MPYSDDKSNKESAKPNLAKPSRSWVTRGRQAAGAYEELLELIYGAGLQPTLWPEVLARLAQGTDARGAFFSIEDSAGTQIHAFHQHGYDERSIQQYASEFYALDEWTHIVMESASGAFLSTDIHCFPHKEWIKKPLYNEWGKAEDIHHATGTYIRLGEDLVFRMSFQRGRAAGMIDYEDLKSLNRLRPHLEKAVLINNRLCGNGLVEASGADIFNQLDRAVVFVDKRGKIIYANRTADNKICHPDFPIRERKGNIDSPVPEIARYLRNAIRQAVAGMQLALPKIFLEFSTHRPWEIAVTPFATSSRLIGLAYEKFCVMVTFKPISLIDNDNVLTQYLCRHFKLTPLEADGVVKLKAGHSPQQIAMQRGVKLSTVRSQLKEAYKKLAVNSQVALLAKLLRLG